MESSDEFQNATLHPRAVRKTYLITYSQANRILFPTRESFGQKIAVLFEKGDSKVKVVQWACCLENHQNGGDHYHMAIKLSAAKRWKSVKDALAKDSGIQVNFSNKHDNYWTAYQYISKSDQNVFHSRNHPNLQSASAPRTSECVKAIRKKRAMSSSTKTNDGSNRSSSAKTKKLSNLDVSEFITKNKIKNEEELYAVAHAQKEEGNKDLAHFLLSRSQKALTDLFESTKRFEKATETVQRSKMTRMEIVERAAENEQCVCNGDWLTCAWQVLVNNAVHPFVFADRVRTLLSAGRGKLRNIIITGPANCGKTFMLRPIEKLFKTFSNPANDKYGWVGADKAEVIFLNDFRWSSELIQWNEMLLLLEGHTVHLPAPKNHFASDVCIDEDTPIFATSKSAIKYIGRYNSTDEQENEMMAVRWHTFQFTKQISVDEQKDVEPCAKCFAKLLLIGQ